MLLMVLRATPGLIVVPGVTVKEVAWLLVLGPCATQRIGLGVRHEVQRCG